METSEDVKKQAIRNAAEALVIALNEYGKPLDIDISRMDAAYLGEEDAVVIYEIRISSTRTLTEQISP